MNIIQQGDQYYIPVTITQDGVAVTPSDISDVRIKIGHIMKTYEDGEVTYDDTRMVWLYPMTEAMSRELSGSIPFQVAIKSPDRAEYIYSGVSMVLFANSIIRDVWTDA